MPRELPIVVWDEDHSALSREMIRELNANSQLEVVDLLNDPRVGFIS